MIVTEQLPYDPTRPFVILVDCGRYFETYHEAESCAKMMATVKRRVVVAQVRGYVAPGGSYKEILP